MEQPSKTTQETREIRIPAFLYERLEKKATEEGLTPSSYVTAVLEGKLLSFAEITQPIQDGVRESGLTEDQIDAYLLETLREVQRENGEVVD